MSKSRTKRNTATRKPFKPFTIDHMDSITILSLYQSLHMADRHKMYLAPAWLVRQSAATWLAKVGVTLPKGARWKTLLDEVCDAYRAILPIDADNNPLPTEPKKD
jgi:hypothetical protein